ncbi:MAG TPA: MFS transporter [Trebonia sp.]
MANVRPQDKQAGEPVEAKAVSWNAALSTYLPALILALGTGIALPAVPTLAKSFDVSFAEASGVTTVFLIGTVVGTVPTGWLIDRFGRRRVMLAGPILTAVMAFLVVVAQNFPELLACRFFDGFASQMWLIGRLAGISHSAAPSQRGKQVSWMFGMDNTGKLAGPLAGGFIATAWGPRAPFVAYGVLALLTLIPGYLYLRDTPRTERSVQQATRTARKLSLREVVMPRLVYFGVVLFAALARGPVQADLLYLYVAYAYHLSSQGIGFLATGAASISLPIGLLAGWMLDRFGRKRAMVPGFAGVAITMGLLAVVAIVHISLGWYLVIFLTGIAFQSLTGGAIQTIGADVAPPEARGMFLGLWRFTGQGGTAISPVMFAFLSSAVNYGASFAFISVSALAVAYLVARHVPESADKTVTLLVPATDAEQSRAAAVRPEPDALPDGRVGGS